MAAAEDEAITLTFTVFNTFLQSLEKLLMVAIAVAAAAAKVSRDRRSKQAGRDGAGGERGIVDADRLERDVVEQGGDFCETTIDISDLFEERPQGPIASVIDGGVGPNKYLTELGLKQYRVVSRKLRDYGVAMGVELGVPDDGRMRVGFDAGDAELVHAALVSAARELERRGLLSDSAASALSASDGDGIRSARGADGFYPKEFTYAGLRFSRDPVERDTWTAPSGVDRGGVVSVRLGEEADSAEWAVCTSAGGEAVGTVSAAGFEPGAVSFFKEGDALEGGDAVLRDARGGARFPAARAPAPSVLHVKEPCEPGDPECCYMDVSVDADAPGGRAPSVPGKPLESAILMANLVDSQLNVPKERLAASRAAAALWSRAAEESAKNGLGGSSPSGANAAEKRYGQAAAAALEASRSKGAAAAAAQQPQAPGAAL